MKRFAVLVALGVLGVTAALLARNDLRSPSPSSSSVPPSVASRSSSSSALRSGPDVDRERRTTSTVARDADGARERVRDPDADAADDDVPPIEDAPRARAPDGRASAECPPDVGAAFLDACPCAGPTSDRPWKNRGQYDRCVARFRNDLARDGCITAATDGMIARCAVASTCGRPDRVLCCFVTSTGTCQGDPVPGDGTTAGKCSNTGAGCDVDATCAAVSGPKVVRDDECARRGGYAVGTGTICGGCPLPPPR